MNQDELARFNESVYRDRRDFSMRVAQYNEGVRRYEEGRQESAARYTQARIDRADALRRQQQEDDRVEEAAANNVLAKRQLRGAQALQDAGAVDKDVALTAAKYLPPETKVNFNKFASKTQAIQQAFGDDPRAQLAPAIQENYKAMLLDRNITSRYEPSEILALAERQALLGADKDGVTLLEQIHKSDLRRDASVLPVFNGPDYKKLPGYDEYKKAVMSGGPTGGSEDFLGDMAKSIGLGVAGAAGAAGAAAAGIPASVAAGLGVVGVGAYTAYDRYRKGILSEGDHPIRDFALDFLGNAGAVAMGAIPGFGAAKTAGTMIEAGAGAGKVAQYVAPAFNKMMLSVGGGETATHLANNWYSDTEYAKANAGTTKDLLARIALGVGSWTLGERIAGAGGIKLVDAAANAIEGGSKLSGVGADMLAGMAKDATARLAVNPTAEQITTAANAQKAAKEANAILSDRLPSQTNLAAYDLMQRTENVASERGWTPIEGNGVTARLNKYFTSTTPERAPYAGTGPDLTGSVAKEGIPFENPMGRDAKLEATRAAGEPGFDLTQSVKKGEVPGDQYNKLASMVDNQVAPEAAPAPETTGRFGYPKETGGTLQDTSKSFWKTFGEEKNARPPKDAGLAEDLKKENVFGPRSPEEVRDSFAEADDQTANIALDMAAKKNIPIVRAADAAMQDTKLAKQAPVTETDVVGLPAQEKAKAAVAEVTAGKPVEEVVKGNKAQTAAIQRLKDAGYTDEDIANVSPSVLTLVKDTSVSKDFLVAMRKTFTPEEGGAISKIGKNRYTSALEEYTQAQAAKGSEYKKVLESYSDQRPEFPYGSDEVTMSGYRKKLTDDYEFAVGERDKLVAMMLKQKPELKTASDETILSEFENHPAGKAFNAEMKKASDEALQSAIEELSDESKNALSTVGESSRRFISETTKGIPTAISENLGQKISAAQQQLSGTSNENLPWKLAMILGVGGLGALGSVPLSEKTAEAGIISGVLDSMKVVLPKAVAPILEGASKEEMSKLIKGLKDKEYIGIPSDIMTGAKGSYMKQLDVAEMAAQAAGLKSKPGESLYNAITHRGKVPIVNSIMTVGGRGRWYYNDYDPAVQLASMQTAKQFNIMKVSGPRVAAIFDSVGAKSNAAEIKKAISPIVNEGAWTEKALSAAMITRDSATKRLAPMLKRAAKMDPSDPIHARVQEIQDRLDNANKIIEAVQPKYSDYATKMEGVYKQLAADKNPATRLFLAAEDTSDFQKYPWLKDMLSENELRAVNLLKDFFLDQRQRLVDAGEKVISKPYAHYMTTSDWQQASHDKAMAFLADKAPIISKAIPYNKMFSRELMAMPKVPDIVASTTKYIYDLENRLGWMGFWQKGNNDGWLSHMRSYFVQNSPGLKAFWDDIVNMASPRQFTTADVWANRYITMEASRLLSFAPSVGAKHLAKMMGQATQIGLIKTARNMDEAAMLAGEYMTGIDSSKLIRDLGGKPSELYDLKRTAVKSLIMQRNMEALLDGMEMSGASMNNSAFDKWTSFFAKKGGVFVNGAEAIDRANTILAGLEMGAKPGTTAQQALYGVYSSIIHNNFLGGALNANWMKSPLAKAIAMFQVTPFKAFERRLTTAMYAGESVKNAWDAVKNLANAQGLAGRIKENGIKELQSLTPGKALEQLWGLRKYITQGEASFKENIVADALFRRGDTYGHSYTGQALKDLLFTTATITAGSQLFGTNLSDYVTHIPFVHLGTGDTEVGLTVSPIVKGTIKNWEEFHVKGNNFSTSTFLRNYLGNQGVMPTFVHKTMRINDRDIPDMYNDSWMRYLFSVPAKE